MGKKQKQLLRLMAKIHRDCFKLDLEFKSAWFFPEYKAVKGYLGTDKIIFVCRNPSLGQFSSKPGSSSNAVTFFYKCLKEYGFENAHLTDIIKSRLSGNQSDVLWKDNKKCNSVIKKNIYWLKEEIKIIDANSDVHIVAVGGKSRKFLEDIKFFKKRMIDLPLEHYAYTERGLSAQKMAERQRFRKQLKKIRDYLKPKNLVSK